MILIIYIKLLLLKNYWNIVMIILDQLQKKDFWCLDTSKTAVKDDNSGFKARQALTHEGNPETEYDSESKFRIYNDLMSYAMRKNEYNSGTQLNTSNYSLIYGLIYFDLTFRTEKVTRDPKQLIFKYKLKANSTDDFNVHAIVLYDEEVVIDKVGNELVIV